MPLPTLALRNLLRNPRRTAIILSAIVFAVIAIILAGGFIEWIFWAMRESTIQSRFGHIQVVRPGYIEGGSADPFAYLLPENPVDLDAIERVEHVKVLTPRLKFSGLISHGETTVGFVGQGVNVEKEELVSQALIISQGKGLSPDEPDGLILGAGLADSLGVEPGERVVLLATTASGGLNALEGSVRGVFTTSTKAFDDSVLRIDISLARQLLRAEGSHTWVISLDATKRTDEVLDSLRSSYAARGKEYQFVPWYELATFYTKTVRLFSSQVMLIWLIISAIVLLTISNVLVMSVLERTREIGTLMAIGLKRRNVLQLFIEEGMLVGIVGGVVGLTLGVALAHGISAIGIPMPPPPGMAVGFTGEILVTWPLVGKASGLAVAAAMLASLYPAWKASRLQITDALRHNL